MMRLVIWDATAPIYDVTVMSLLDSGSGYWSSPAFNTPPMCWLIGVLARHFPATVKVGLVDFVRHKPLAEYIAHIPYHWSYLMCICTVRSCHAWIIYFALLQNLAIRNVVAYWKEAYRIKYVFLFGFGILLETNSSVNNCFQNVDEFWITTHWLGISVEFRNFIYIFQ